MNSENLVERMHSAITRLTEYRQTLVASAFTGKLDVRGAVTPATEMT